MKLIEVIDDCSAQLDSIDFILVIHDAIGGAGSIAFRDVKHVRSAFAPKPFATRATAKVIVAETTNEETVPRTTKKLVVAMTDEAILSILFRWSDQVRHQAGERDHNC